MELKGQYEISATRKKVWEALNDPKVLQGAIPGIETLEKNDIADQLLHDYGGYLGETYY